MDLAYLLVLGLAVSIDGFFAGAAYGVKRIQVPFFSLLAIGAVTLFCTEIAHELSFCFADFLHAYILSLAGALLLIGIGICNLLWAKLSSAEAGEETLKPLTFSCGKIVISVMAKPEAADLDHSNRLSLSEALLLGAALGADNMVATFAAGLTNSLPFYTPLVMCCIQTLLVSSGILLARRITSSKLKERSAYAPGCILILLGLLRLF